MTAYYVLTHTITADLEQYQREYIGGAMRIMAKHQGEVIAAVYQAEVLHGSPPEGVVILRFPSAEAVRAFVNDPEYQPLKQVRLALTKDSSAVLVPAFEMAGG